MSSDQILMAGILLGVGGLFLLGFLLIRRWTEAKRIQLQQRLGPGALRLPSPRVPAETGLRSRGGPTAGKPGGDLAIEPTSRVAGGVRQPASQLPIDPAIANPPRGLSDRVDAAFNRMVGRTGLDWTPEQALGVMCLVGVLAAAGAYLWREELWVSLNGLVLGLAAPLGVLMYLQARWKKQLQEQMPDAFFFLARSLRAGLSMEQALSAAGSQGARPFADELKRCADRVQLGLAIPTALELAARRIQLVDFNVFVSVVALHQTTGGNLALQLDRLATSVRDRNQYQGYFRSATALGRISAIAIGAAIPLIFLGYALFEPDYALRFFESSTGIAMLCTAFVLEIIGVLWLYALLKASY